MRWARRWWRWMRSDELTGEWLPRHLVTWVRGLEKKANQRKSDDAQYETD